MACQKTGLGPNPHPFGVFNKVAPTGTLGDALGEDTILNGLLCPLDNLCEGWVLREVVEVSTAVA